jgi:hypothetical protein
VTLTPGDVYRNTVLGLSSLYRVAGFKDDLVVVEVIQAPGLPAGQVLRFTRSALAAMRRVESQAGSIDSALQRWIAAA